MKANELMLGDWVYGLYPNGDRYHRPFRISAVDTYPNNRSPRIVTEGGYGFQEEHLEPIPLTPEILEKNGFRQDKKCPFVYETDDEDVIIDLYDPAPNARLSKKEDYDKMVGVRLSPAPPYGFSYWGQSLMIRANYIHELQHALRLCGIEKEIII